MRSIKTDLDFQYTLNHKNYGLIEPDEAHELFYEGYISILNPEKHEFPQTIGLFEVMIYDLEKAKKFNQYDIMVEFMKDLSNDKNSRFTNIYDLIDDFNLGFTDKDRIIYLKNVIIHPEFRKMGVFDELIKSIYLTHYTSNSLLIVNSSPIQNINEELKFHMKEYLINVSKPNGSLINMSSGEFFNLKSLPDADDEYNYKLYARMQKLNLKQYHQTDFFYYENEDDVLKLFN